jgi:hypothetical protein
MGFGVRPFWLVTSLLPAALAAAAGGAAELSLSHLEPSVIPPYEAVTLRLIGRGFEAGAEVLIEGSASGRYVRHRPSRVTAELCEIELPLGFGPRPAERRVSLRNPNGDQTAPLVLQIRGPQKAARGEPAAAEEPPPPPEGAVRPRILDLRPPGVAAGRPFFLQVRGSGFADGAAIEVTANRNAGSTRLPDYGPRAFVAEWIDAELLEVDFDRGFYPIPGVRDVVVVNPDGGRSNPASLHIQPEENEQ